MTVRKAVLVSCIAFVLPLGIASGVTVRTIAMYNGVCEELEGFPGFLQSTGFVARGKCVFTAPGVCLSTQKCAVNGVAGHCKKETINSKNYCVCQPNPISP